MLGFLVLLAVTVVSLVPLTIVVTTALRWVKNKKEFRKDCTNLKGNTLTLYAYQK